MENPFHPGFGGKKTCLCRTEGTRPILNNWEVGTLGTPYVLVVQIRHSKCRVWRKKEGSFLLLNPPRGMLLCRLFLRRLLFQGYRNTVNSGSHAHLSSRDRNIQDAKWLECSFFNFPNFGSFETPASGICFETKTYLVWWWPSIWNNDHWWKHKQTYVF